MVKSFSKLIFCLVILSQVSCLDQIELNIPKEALDGLVFQGSMIKNGDAATISMTVRFLTSSGVTQELSKLQEAFIENELGQKLMLPYEAAAHRGVVKENNPDFTLKTGMKYRFAGTAVNGRRYESDFMTLLSGPKIQDIRYHVSEFNVLTLAIDTKILDENGKQVILKWDVENNYKYTDQLEGNPPGKLCYVTSKADLRNVKMYDGRKADFTEIKDLDIYTRNVDYVFSEGYYGTIIQQAIDENTFKYFTQVNELNQREGNIYEPPAGTIITNLREVSGASKAFGFFYAAEQDTIRLYISPEELGNPSRECPVPPSETSSCPVRSCCDCLILKGASLNRPSFWIE